MDLRNLQVLIHNNYDSVINNGVLGFLRHPRRFMFGGSPQIKILKQYIRQKALENRRSDIDITLVDFLSSMRQCYPNIDFSESYLYGNSLSAQVFSDWSMRDDFTYLSGALNHFPAYMSGQIFHSHSMFILPAVMVNVLAQFFMEMENGALHDAAGENLPLSDSFVSENNKRVKALEDDPLLRQVGYRFLSEDDVPKELLCPLSKQIFTDPVHNREKGLPAVERNWIVKWVCDKGTNPFTRQALALEDLKDDTKMVGNVETFLKKQGELKLKKMAEYSAHNLRCQSNAPRDCTPISPANRRALYRSVLFTVPRHAVEEVACEKQGKCLTL